MSGRRVEVRFIFLVLFLLLPVLFLTLILDQAEAVQVEADQLEDSGWPSAGDWFVPTVDSFEATAVGYVFYDGAPVAGADVYLLRDEIMVYNTTTALGSGTVPSFTVTLSDPPVNATPGELLTLWVDYSGEINRSTFAVQPGEQTLAGWLSSSCGPTEIAGGMITSDTTWTPECGPYNVRGNLQVATGATLTIEAGTTIIFDADKAMLVSGRLLTAGASNALVSFTGDPADPWAYLSFDATSTGSILVGTLAEFAGSLGVANNAAIRIDGADVTLNGVIVHSSEADGIQVFNNGSAPMDGLMVFNNQGRGISVDTNAGLSIQNSLVGDNAGAGISVEGSTEGTISGNIVEFNGDSGIRIYRAGGPISISGNRIVGNTASIGGGLDVRYTQVNIQDNFIAANEASNGGGGIYYYVTSNETEIIRNYVLYNKAQGTSQAGGGMFLHAGNIQVTNNIFAGNLASETPTTHPAPGGGLYIHSVSSGSNVAQNAFIHNFAMETPGGALYANDPQTILEANTIVDNIASSSPAGDWGAVQLGKPAVINNNNLFGNSTYDLYNGAPVADGTVDAQSNWWGTTEPAEISQQIYDWSDDATLGVVDYANWLAEPWIAAPVSPPSVVTATVDGSSITVNWPANPESDLAGYKIYLDSSDFLFIPAVDGDLAGIDVDQVTSFSLDCLQPGTYYLAVTAYDNDADGLDDWTDGNESWFSREIAVTTFATPSCDPPAAPTGLNATPFSASRINLDWTDNATDETAYRVEHSPDGVTGWSEVATLAPNTTTHGDSGLACNTTYFYRTRAYRVGDGQYSAYSNVDQAATMACLPAAPSGLGATSVSANQIDLSWSDNASDETGYRVERSPDGSTGWSEIASLVANSAAYSDTGLACGTAYYYRVRAYRAGDGQFSAYSNVDDATTGACPPAAPTGLNATAVSTSQIDLSWTDNATDETAYRVERSPNGSTGWSEIANLAANSTSYSNTGLACGITFYYRVRAYRAGDSQFSDYSNVDQATTVCPPSVPTSLSATAVSASQINLSWTDNATDETAYRVERSPNGSTGWSEISNLAANSTAYSDGGLACNTPYYYRVRAYRAGDGQFSAYSNEDHDTTTACAPPAAPSNLSAAAVSDSQINLSWTDNTGDETAYRVERSPNGSTGWGEIASLAANTTAYSDSGLACGTTRYYRVRAYRAGDGQYSAYSNVAHDTTETCGLEPVIYLPVLIHP